MGELQEALANLRGDFRTLLETPGFHMTFSTAGPDLGMTYFSR